MDRERLKTWVGGYVRAWETNDPDEIARLFAEDALYYTAPGREPWRGREAIVAGWLARRDEPGTWTFRHEILAVVGDPSAGTKQTVGFVRGWTDYAATAGGPATSCDNLWVIRLDAAGRATEFTEWWMERGKQEPEG